MNDQSKLMNQAPPMMSLSQPLPLMMTQPPPPPPQMMVQSSQAMAAQQQQSQLMMMKGQSQPMMMNRNNYNKPWPQQPQPPFAGQKPQPSSNLGRNNNWKGKKGTDKRKDIRRMDLNPNVANLPMSGGQTSGGGGGGYIPPTLHELQSQNRMKARKFYPKKKFNNRFAPYAPRNTTSFIIRAKKAGGIASLVSPCPVTPAVLPTPNFSPSREVLGDMAKEEWGVDGYGSMKGLIRLRSPGNDDDEEEGGGGSSESDVEEHVEVERRLDHDLSRFEMVYPNYSGVEYNNALENRVDDQDTHIAQLEEENMTMKERLFLMERELAELRRRVLFIERRGNVVEEVNEEVVENGSENDSDGGSDAPHSVNAEVLEYVSRDGVSRSEHVRDVDVGMEECVPHEMTLKLNEAKDEARNYEAVGDHEIEEVKSELIREEVIGNENEVEDKVVNNEVETKNGDDLMQG